MQNFVVELPSLGILEISGEDAGSFLQAQCTSDIDLLADLCAQISAWCNPQGRVIADFIILRKHDAYLMILPADLTEKLQQGLSRYILRSNVAITDKSNTYRCIGIYGSETIARMSEYVDQNRDQNQFYRIDLPVYTGKRSMVIDTSRNNNLLLEISGPNLQAADEHIWYLLDIKAGLPWIDSRTSEKVLPQEIFLDHLGGLSYNKGCYPGQEIIARIHYRSKLNNKLYYGITKPGLKPIQPGAAIYDDSHSKKAGLVINTVTGLDNRQLLLAVMDSDLSDNNIFMLEDGNKIQIKFVIAECYRETG